MTRPLPLKRKIEHGIVQVTPDTAVAWLEANTHNRDVRQTTVDQIAGEMSAGRWAFNGEPIQFDHNGVLLNGQHRLWAVVQSGTTQQFLVVRGLAPDTQLTMDQGNRRTPKEQLHLSGLAVDNSVAAAIRVYLQWQTGRFFGDQAKRDAKIATTEIVEWAHSHPQSIEIMRDLLASGVRRLPVRPSISLAVGLRFCEIDREAAQLFLGSLISGADLHSGSPRLALLQRLRRIKDSGTHVTDKEMVGFFVVAWNAERRGRSMTKLQRPDGAAWTRETFPVPR